MGQNFPGHLGISRFLWSDFEVNLGIGVISDPGPGVRSGSGFFPWPRTQMLSGPGYLFLGPFCPEVLSLHFTF